MSTIMEKELPMRARGVCIPRELGVQEDRVERLVELLKAVADPTRVQILAILNHSREPVCICDLTATFGLTQPTISHHMGKLRRAGLVASSRRGIWSYYSLSSAGARQVDAILDLASSPRC
jgi:ArsR family transcriptional regulator